MSLALLLLNIGNELLLVGVEDGVISLNHTLRERHISYRALVQDQLALVVVVH